MQHHDALLAIHQPASIATQLRSLRAGGWSRVRRARRTTSRECRAQHRDQQKIASAHRFSPVTFRQRDRSEEHTSELQSLMRISYAVFCLKKKKQNTQKIIDKHTHINLCT